MVGTMLERGDGDAGGPIAPGCEPRQAHPARCSQASCPARVEAERAGQVQGMLQWLGSGGGLAWGGYPSPEPQAEQQSPRCPQAALRCVLGKSPELPAAVHGTT